MRRFHKGPMRRAVWRAVAVRWRQLLGDLQLARVVVELPGAGCPRSARRVQLRRDLRQLESLGLVDVWHLPDGLLCAEALTTPLSVSELLVASRYRIL